MFSFAYNPSQSKRQNIATKSCHNPPDDFEDEQLFEIRATFLQPLKKFQAIF